MNRPESLLLIACMAAVTWLLVKAAIRGATREAQKVIDAAIRYDLDDCVSRRPEDDDEAKWHAEFDKWVREEKARQRTDSRPYNHETDGL